ncbi:MAG: LLM class flavin-dependent oxidoreductase [Pseudonocardiaceae bacterium]|nr:LLM class flavin-dependent oxidoreductase [Pseudonocardiaceae bacterium]
MHPGVLLLFQNYGNQVGDDEIYHNNLKLAELADGLGYNSVWCVEHHFDADYSMCPDNTQLLSYLAGRTSNIKLATGAVILPWNDPLRVVEKISLLDQLAPGRVIFGMGRGLARMEYEGQRQDMNESRERFDEAAEMILRGLESGVVENDGDFYKQPRVEVHPAPLASFKGRAYAVAMSPDSAVAAGKLGVGMTSFIQGPVEEVHMPIINAYRESYRQHHGSEPPPPILSDLGYCHHDADEAKKVTQQYAANYFRTCVTHYEFGGEHFANTKGYQHYNLGAQALKEAGMEAVTDAFVGAQISGTPDQIIEQYHARKEMIGPFEPLFVPYHGGIPYDKAEESFKLMTKEVMPELLKL